MRNRHLPTMMILFALSLVSGCASDPLVPGPSYPESLSRRGTLDIQVVVEGRQVTLTNTTASSLPAGRLWLNAWYSASTSTVAVGDTLTIPITDFRDEHGQIMRGGGFFASEPPEQVFLAQWQAPDGLYGMVVVR